MKEAFSPCFKINSNMSTQLSMYALLTPLMEYVCPECGKIFTNQLEWRKHIDGDHEYKNKEMKDLAFQEVNRYFECQICLKWITKDFHSLGMMQYHYFSHRPYGKIYRCLLCKSLFERRRQLAAHLKDNHKRDVDMLATSKNNQMGFFMGSELCIKKEPVEGKRDLLQKALFESNIDLQAETQMFTAVKTTNATHSNHQRLLDKQIKIKRERKSSQVDRGDNKKIKYDEQKEETLKKTRIQSSNDQEISSKSGNDTKCSTESVDRFVLFLCPKCGEKFDAENNWRNHVLEAHNFKDLIANNFKIFPNTKSSICLLCKKVQNTVNPIELQKHHIDHLPYPNYLMCKICSVTRPYKHKMFRHIKKKHASELVSTLIFLCNKCNGEFGDSAALEAHKNVCRDGVTLDSLMEHVLQRKARLLELARKHNVEINDLLIV